MLNYVQWYCDERKTFILVAILGFFSCVQNCHLTFMSLDLDSGDRNRIEMT